MPTIEDEDLDRPIWGIEPIAREAGLVDEHGNVEIRKAFYLCQKVLVPAGVVSKQGRRLQSTPRRLRNHFRGAA